MTDDDQTISLVTGATGFLGRVIAEQLIGRGERVRALCRSDAPELVELGVEIACGDIRDRVAVTEACAGVDTVYHAAGVAGIWGSWQHFYSINTEGTQNVISGCHAQGVQKLVYTSSPSVSFDGSPQEGVDESQPYPDRWLCHYPHSKALAEKAVLEANQSTAMRTCSLRPHLIWGPGDRHLIPRLLTRARKGRLRRVGDGSNLVDMVFVDNAAEAHLSAADALQAGSPVCGQAYF
ncbi:MAG: NAD-dependent epimerase/dehydratase family protein, partial [Planctomycetales bacterium]